MTRALLSLAILAAAVGASTPATAATVDVQVRNNLYAPQQVEVAVGDTVRWTAIDGGHTVTASDASFDSGLLTQSQTFEQTFTEDATLTYYCSVHAGMIGAVVVGDGGDLDPPEERPERTVPSEYPTIAAALTGAAPYTIVNLQPGTYAGPVQILTPGLTLRGAGATRDEVVIDGGDALYAALLLADHAELESLTVTGALFAGVNVAGVDGFRIEDVALADNGRFGVLVERSRGGYVAGSVATGHRTAGFQVERCVECDTVFDGVVASGNLTGLAGLNAGGLVVKGSTFSGNGTGIALKTAALYGDAADETAPQRGSHVYGNVISGNSDRSITPPTPTDRLDVATGAGVWINGGSFNVVEGNEISGHGTYGVVITGLGAPPLENRIAGNVVTSSTVADLAWDGLGARNCFGGNQAGATEPPAAQTIYDCGLPATVGIAMPTVDATILDWAAI
ncbi:MAG TPA: right-handed parallel beta-helix repeat-containing protein [Actinomycetota bacterium]